MLAEFLVLALMAGQAAPRQALFQSPYSLDDMRGKQAVVLTSMGTFVIQLMPEAAPTNVALFMKLARDGGFAQTIVHRVVRYGVIQGGDPFTRDPAKAATHGQGGFNQLRYEPNTEKHTAGAISTVRDPARPDSGGSQFFICVTDQPDLDGQYVVFGRVVEGLEVVQQISAVDADAEGVPRARVEIKAVTIRDTPAEPFVKDTAVELGSYRAMVETTMGTLELEMLAQVAPETVRNFLRLSVARVYDGVRIFRVSPNFVIQTGALMYRDTPLTASQQQLVHNLQPEFSDTANVPGVVSMARGDDPASATTSFFICTGQCRSLQGIYTVFARVVGGMEVLTTIATVPVDGETPRTPIVVTRVRVEKK